MKSSLEFSKKQNDQVSRGAAGNVAASDTRDPRFEPRRQQNGIYPVSHFPRKDRK